MKTNTHYILIFVTAIALASSACGLSGLTGEDPLDGTAWTLTAYRKSKPLPGTEITLSFTDGEVQGSAGCNSYGGSYSLDGQNLTIQELYATEMYCMDPEGIMEQESDYLGSLRQVNRFDLTGDQLILHHTDQETLTFERR